MTLQPKTVQRTFGCGSPAGNSVQPLTCCADVRAGDGRGMDELGQRGAEVPAARRASAGALTAMRQPLSMHQKHLPPRLMPSSSPQWTPGPVLDARRLHYHSPQRARDRPRSDFELLRTAQRASVHWRPLVPWHCRACMSKTLPPSGAALPSLDFHKRSRLPLLARRCRSTKTLVLHDCILSQDDAALHDSDPAQANLNLGGAGLMGIYFLRRKSSEEAVNRHLWSTVRAAQCSPSRCGDCNHRSMMAELEALPPSADAYA